ncbi:hypothetical protein PV08_11735 [Exophiala spinifera]|uniref:Uncharacterized protein n=1 Tax=Exophiala spinifera TaxID=91928 RepID=A0A0D2BF43_9EURO|nr:uncharacterized protein PV08_11735 [Exophiala spinifera]KIW09959.1 hypothetical protein PV08_11735 [Exophiala spinifera]
MAEERLAIDHTQRQGFNDILEEINELKTTATVAAEEQKTLKADLASLTEKFPTFAVDLGIAMSSTSAEQIAAAKAKTLQMARKVLSKHPEIIQSLAAETTADNTPLSQQLNAVRTAVRRLEAILEGLTKQVARFGEEQSSFARAMDEAVIRVRATVIAEQNEIEQAKANAREKEQENTTLTIEQVKQTSRLQTLEKLQEKVSREKEALQTRVEKVLSELTESNAHRKLQEAQLSRIDQSLRNSQGDVKFAHEQYSQVREQFLDRTHELAESLQQLAEAQQAFIKLQQDYHGVCQFHLDREESFERELAETVTQRERFEGFYTRVKQQLADTDHEFAVAAEESKQHSAAKEAQLMATLSEKARMEDKMAGLLESNARLTQENDDLRKLLQKAYQATKSANQKIQGLEEKCTKLCAAADHHASTLTSNVILHKSEMDKAQEDKAALSSEIKALKERLDEKMQGETQSATLVQSLRDRLRCVPFYHELIALSGGTILTNMDTSVLDRVIHRCLSWEESSPGEISRSSQPILIEGLFNEEEAGESPTQTLLALLPRLEASGDRMSLADIFKLTTAIMTCSFQGMELSISITLSFLVTLVEEDRFVNGTMEEMALLYCACTTLMTIEDPHRRATFNRQCKKTLSSLVPNSTMAQQLTSLVDMDVGQPQQELAARLKASAEENDIGVTVGIYHLHMDNEYGVVIAEPHQPSDPPRIGFLKPTEIELKVDVMNLSLGLQLTCTDAHVIGTWSASWPLDNTRVAYTFIKACKAEENRELDLT